MTLAAAKPDVMLVGNGSPEHVGAHFRRAALSEGWPLGFLDVRRAERGPALWRALHWRLRDRRASGMAAFGRQVVLETRRAELRCLVAVGLAPLDSDCLKRLGELGVTRVNYLTDDPWNPAHRSEWFFRALREYDLVFSTRRANLEDLHRCGCRRVEYLPFAYAGDIHYPATVPDDEKAHLGSDVVFAGGADPDRVPLLSALIRSGCSVGLYGGYWDRYPETKCAARGMAPPDLLRRAVASAGVALCLVRRANRDGHAMRSFEVPAMGGCPLMELTGEHREIFGEEGAAVLYFQSAEEMVDKVRWLLARPEERRRLAAEAHRIVTQGKNTYADRLREILRVSGAGGSIA